MFIDGSVTEKVHKLLVNLPNTRDKMSSTVWFYRSYYPLDMAKESSIERAWRLVQRKCPELRGSGWEDRQKHAAFMGKSIKHRNLGQIEDLSHIFGNSVIDVIRQAKENPQMFKKKNWFQKFISKFF